jgi:hypothetical protein
MNSAATDNFAIYFADKLWKLLPAVYRAEDTDKFDANGPLREMTLRIGATAAEIRRNLDRLWEDQSIETCDDWVIPYLADLLDTRLVYGLDAGGQRLDVANTIDYRRRKGTLGVIEQVANDITRWDVKAVEFFRSLARTRHGLDPAVAAKGAQGAALMQAAGLIGALTRTPAGGFADLRNVYGGKKTGGAFDEYFYTADARMGRGRCGWRAIPHLGLFVWRLKAFLVGPTTPVPVNGCPGWFCFDPTGRDAPLFNAAEALDSADWVATDETRVRGPISQALLNASLLTPEIAGAGQTGAVLKTRFWGENPASLPNPGDLLTIEGVNAFHPQSGDTGVEQIFAVAAPVSADMEANVVLTLHPPIVTSGAGRNVTGSPADGAQLQLARNEAEPLYPATIRIYAAIGDADAVPAKNLTLRPERGRFFLAGGKAPAAVWAYGFSSEIGAGPYDRNGQATSVPLPGPETVLTGGGDALVNAPASAGTVTFDDSLTYHGPSAPRTVQSLTLRAGEQRRPLVRLAPGVPFVLIGSGPDATLTLDGLFVSGGDIVLQGQFGSVTLACCTLDPGKAAPSGALSSPPAAHYALAADGRELVPTRLIVEAAVTSLVVDRCVLGPVRTRETPPGAAAAPQGAGYVEQAGLANSVIQAIESQKPAALAAGDVQDPALLLRQLQLGLDPVAALVRQARPGIVSLFGALSSPPLATPQPSESLLSGLLAELNTLIAGPSIFQPAAFANVALSDPTLRLLAKAVANQPAPRLNRALLEDAFPLELANAALAFGDGELALSRCTILGRVVAHRLEASECVLQKMTAADDLQHGCVRFSAFAQSSRVPRPYECVQIPDGAPLFVSTDLGQPAYAQLAPTVDLNIIPDKTAGGAPENTISAGAVDGSEMGAYARDKNPIRARALILKMQEFMPAGITPVVINAT